MSYSSEVLADSPSIFLKLDETSGSTAADSSGYGFDFGYFDSVTLGQASLLGDGSGKSIALAVPAHVGRPGAAWMELDEVTVEARVRPDAAVLSNGGFIASRWGGGVFGKRQWHFGVTSAGKLTATVRSYDGDFTVTGSTTLAADTAYTATLRFSYTTGTLSVALNGTPDGSVAFTGGRMGVSDEEFALGRFALSDGVGLTWTGRLDEFSFTPAYLSDARLAARHAAAVAASSGVTGSGAATAPAGVASGAGTVTVVTTGSGAATAPPASASGAGVVTVTGSGSATAPAGVASGAGTILGVITGSGAAVAPAGAASGAGTVDSPGPSTGSGGAVAPAGVASGTGDSGDSLDPWTGGAQGEALLFLDVPAGVLEVTYPASVPPAAIVEVALERASHQMPALTGVRAMDYPIETDVVGVPHVWVDGVDVTYFRDHPTKISGWRDESPFGWTSTTLTFPQVFHFEEPGTGDLWWMRPDAPVQIAIVRPDGSRLHRFTGQLTSDDPGVGRGRTECVWGVEGLLWQADHAHHDVPARLDPTDVGTLIPREMNDTPSRRFAPFAQVTTGILSRQRGSTGQTRWGYTTDQLATAVREDGKQWTIEPTGPTSFRLALKDTTTVHWTVTAGAPGVELDLSHDHHERIDAVYAQGVGPDGYAWSNLFFPDLLPYDPPDYPYADPSRNVLLGDRDSDTLTGHAISDWQQRIRDLGYTSLAVDGVMNSADIAAVRWIQRKRGILVDGYMGPQTWAATWNVGTIGGDLSTVRLPMAVRPEVEKYVYAANGAVVGLNPDYDPSIIRHEIDVDFGAGVTKAQGREMAQRILERGMDPGIAGTIRLTTCPWEGSRWEINSGDNVLLKGFRGSDVLMRVVAVDADPESLTVSLTVDSEFRDAMVVEQVLQRNRESRPDPARRPGNPNRRSRMDQDMVTPFEGESPAGRLPKMALFGGLWTVWPVPVSEVGVIAKLRFKTSGPATKFYLAMFGKPVTANQIAAKVPNPGAKTNPWEDAGEAWLNSVAWIEGWGEQGAAAGYGMLGSEADGSPVTGELYDDAGVPYVSQKAPWVWVAMYAPVSTFIEGRIYPDPTQ